MFEKLINKIIMQTKCYLILQEDRKKTLKQLGEQVLKNGQLEKQVISNIKIARKIIRTINKKDDKLAIQLCRKIIKGEI